MASMWQKSENCASIRHRHRYRMRIRLLKESLCRVICLSRLLICQRHWELQNWEIPHRICILLPISTTYIRHFMYRKCSESIVFPGKILQNPIRRSVLQERVLRQESQKLMEELLSYLISRRLYRRSIRKPV